MKSQEKHLNPWKERPIKLCKTCEKQILGYPSTILSKQFCNRECATLGQTWNTIEPPSKDTLLDLYFNQKMTTTQLAKLYSVSKGCIYNWMKKYDIAGDKSRGGLSHIGKFYSDEWKKNISQAHLKKGLNHHMCGAKHPQFKSPEKYPSRAKGGFREDIGIYVRSSWEANYSRYLNFLLSHKKILAWEYEKHTFYFEKIKKGCRSYTPDFKVFNLDGTHYWAEVKGWMSPESKTKLKRFTKYFPDEKLILIDKKWFLKNTKQLSGLIPGWEKGCSRQNIFKQSKKIICHTKTSYNKMP